MVRNIFTKHKCFTQLKGLRGRILDVAYQCDCPLTKNLIMDLIVHIGALWSYSQNPRCINIEAIYNMAKCRLTVAKRTIVELKETIESLTFDYASGYAKTPVEALDDIYDTLCDIERRIKK